jgi:hypothetical protein
MPCTTAQSPILSVATPDRIMARTPMFWSRYFDVCALKPTEVAPKNWVLTIAGPTGEEEAPAGVTCSDGVSRWIEQALRMAGAKSPTVIHTRCRFDGAPECASEVRR